MAALGPYLKEIGGLVMGRVSYEQMRGFGPGPFDDIPTVVLTTNSKLQVGASAQVGLEGPQGAIDAIEKRIDGDIWLFGGGKTAACFLDEGLIDLIELTSYRWCWARDSRSSQECAIRSPLNWYPVAWVS